MKYQIYSTVWYSVHTIDHANIFRLLGRHIDFEVFNYLKHFIVTFD